MKRLILFAILLVTITAVMTHAVNGAPLITPIQYIDFSTLQQSKTARVQAVLSPYTLQLEDGSLIHLSSLDIPGAQGDQTGPYALMVMDVMEDAFLGQEITLYQGKDRAGLTNRMGHLIGHIERKSDKLWAQGMLLRLGLARVRTRSYTPDLSASMLAIENAARLEKAGLWAQDVFRIYDAASPALNDLKEGFAIIEGNVRSTAIKNNRVYINFGNNWKTDMTVSIAPSDKKRFLEASVDPLGYNGKTLRVRGWLEHYNGPYIQISHPQAVQVIDPPKETN